MRPEYKHKKTERGKQEERLVETRKKFGLLKNEVPETTAEQSPLPQESRPKRSTRGKMLEKVLDKYNLLCFNKKEEIYDCFKSIIS